MVVDVRIEIERARDEVAAYVGDPDNASAWYEHIKAVELLRLRSDKSKATGPASPPGPVESSVGCQR